MDKLVPTLVVAAVLLLALAGMYAGWRRRTRRDASLHSGHATPGTPAATLAAAECFYVATTRHGEPLERLALPGLGFRGRASLVVTSDGIELAVQGERPVYLPAASLSNVGPATVTIDRVVEKDGLSRISWVTTTGIAVDTYLRIVDPNEHVRVTDAIRTLLPAGASAEHPTESEV